MEFAAIDFETTGYENGGTNEPWQLGGCDGYPPHDTDQVLECGAYIDTSVLHRRWHYDEPMRLLRSWPRDRILFGTDFPWVQYSEAISWVKSVRDPKDWDALFGGNACRLLGI